MWLKLRWLWRYRCCQNSSSMFWSWIVVNYEINMLGNVLLCIWISLKFWSLQSVLFDSSSTLSTCRNSICHPSVDRNILHVTCIQKLNMYWQHGSCIGAVWTVSGVKNRLLSTCIQTLNMFNFWMHVESSTCCFLHAEALHVESSICCFLHVESSACRAPHVDRQCGLGISVCCHFVVDNAVW